MGSEESAKDGGQKVHEVLRTLHTRMTEGMYPVGSPLPPQRELAQDLKVSRDTVQKALRQLVHEGWIESRQGSGSKVLKTRTVQSSARAAVSAEPVRLGSLIGAAFEEPEVAIDVFTLTSESLDAHVRIQDERIRAGVIKPQSILIRMLLPSDGAQLPYPYNKRQPADPRPQKRLRRIKRHHTESMQGVLKRLDRDMADLTAHVEIRHVPLVPYSKIYLLNGREALQGPYTPVEQQMELEDGETVTAVDVIGVGSTLTHSVKSDDPTSQEAVIVDSLQAWFDACWELLAE
ncbi:winged helix-turn-helix domain-containing protein [Streptomyces cavernae]|uniref:winged helix-turn-helix domain-containing protein n=1 Tax=Streptomyces cavernae TaxID=2259034 RepID=UPI001EE3AABB|nr:winged helix-turn-helix domain-containing protein [Streptomyces cavernae]